MTQSSYLNSQLAVARRRLAASGSKTPGYSHTRAEADFTECSSGMQTVSAHDARVDRINIFHVLFCKPSTPANTSYRSEPFTLGRSLVSP